MPVADLGLARTAYAWHDGGACTLPVGTGQWAKRPPMSNWTKYQSEPPTREQWGRWLASPECQGIGLVTGAVSGNLEGLEVEGHAADLVPDLISAIRRTADERGFDGGALITELMTYVERSPRGGFHWVYRVVGTPVLGNTPLARRPDPNNGGRPKPIIETRGEGGFFVAAPTPAACHNEEKIREAGIGWEIITGTPGVVGTLVAEEYELVHEVARTFDEMPAAESSETPTPRVTRPNPVERPPGDLRPGDDFNERADWADILVPAGWTFVRTRGDGTSEWTRPGKHPREGISATTGYGTRGFDLFFPFTTSTEFTAGKSYDKYACFALLEHGGNWSAAGRELRRRGYGSNRPREKADPMTAVFGENWRVDSASQPNGSSPSPSPAAPVTSPSTSPVASPVAAPDPLIARALSGGGAILDVPDVTPAVCGIGDQVLMAEGESLMIVAPTGVGKTTTTGQLLRGLLGLDDKFLGMNVKPIGRVLYLALDRPAQIRRSLHRQFTADERAVLDERLILWDGPLPGDFGDDPTLLRRMAQSNGADGVIIDSLKDAVVGLTDDKIAASYNRGRQELLAANSQLIELHHQTKRGPNGTKPNDLAAVYGSMHLTGGAGSVVLLWGDAGDPVIELRHLKPPAEEIGPMRLLVHADGQVTVHHGLDLVELARECRDGLTARFAAVNLYPPTKDRPLSDSDIERARRKLDSLCKRTPPLLHKKPGAARNEIRYHAREGVKGFAQQMAVDELSEEL